MAIETGLIQAETLGQLHSLDVAARIIVEGLRGGSHRSPLKGHSVDFADHRPYVAGDDTRHLDWKVMARSDRLVLKRYEAEMDLTCVCAVDGSGSMAFQGERASVSKYRYASILAASISYLVLNQQDRMGLILFAEDGVSEQQPALQGQLLRICGALDAHKPDAGTDTGQSLSRLAAPSVRRGLVVIISDCLEEPDTIISAIDRLRHRGHDVALIWVLDPDEVDLGVGAISRFEGLEGEGELVAEPRALRQAYKEIVANHRQELKQACLARRVVFVDTDTGQAPHLPLNRLLVALQHG